VQIFEVLAPFDLMVLKFLNVTIAHPWLDQFWLTITQLHKLGWVRWAVLPAVVGGLVYRWRWHAIKPLLMVGLAVALTDAVGYRVIKSNVGRPRPFENAAISSWVRKVGKAHGSSFPSNHAANCFAAAGVLAWYFGRGRKYFDTLAFLVAVSRVALGVHYPTDVVAGAALGALIAFFVKTMIISHLEFLRLPVEVAPQFDRNSRNS
jgi:undecaprenyl-diphosphatase